MKAQRIIAHRVAWRVIFHTSLTGVVLAQPCEVAKLEGDPYSLSSFGTAVAISGDYAVVGDGGDGHGGESNTGAAYIFHRVGETWQRQQKIFGSGTGFDDLFGASVAIEGDRIVVGAPVRVLDTSWPGYAFVFQRQGETWVETQKLISGGSVPNDEFGRSVSISGDRIAVGAPSQNNFAGRVYVFRWNGAAFIEQASLAASDPGQVYLGTAVSINGDRLVGGATYAGPAGAAYIFRNDGPTWSQEAKLTASDAAQGDAFGTGKVSS